VKRRSPLVTKPEGHSKELHTTAWENDQDQDTGSPEALSLGSTAPKPGDAPCSSCGTRLGWAMVRRNRDVHLPECPRMGSRPEPQDTPYVRPIVEPSSEPQQEPTEHREPAQFIAALGRNDLVQICTIADGICKVAGWYHPGDQSQPRQNIDTYYAPAVLNPAMLRQGQRGSAEYALGVRELYADLDVKPGGLPTWQAAHDVIADLSRMLGTTPAAVVHSGHGLQPHWRLDRDDETDWPDKDDPRWHAVNALYKQWPQLVEQVAKAHSGAVDPVFDMARILRLPGSVNHKYPAAPVPVTVTYPEDARSVSLARVREALDGHLIAEETSPERPPIKSQSAGSGAPNARALEGILRRVANEANTRNNLLFWGANRLVENGYPETAFDVLAEAAAYAGLPDWEITKTINSAWRGAA
jgi:hypothetical protein